ncbi:MAG TPA: TOPRIM nucleotidyl transferase/hydrolase domain-containing protein [Vicinamibacterales bacterium]|nr:TOPRIM nucleotidyl transferase/hydrolase domain-containing protein [Vicinamibacterales bacterium]
MLEVLRRLHSESTLTEPVVADLERYLDVTRGEMLFAKGVILVEGDAERFLIRQEQRRTVSISTSTESASALLAGTQFVAYVELLGLRGLQIPFAVITDRDSREDNTDLGVTRVIKLLRAVIAPRVMPLTEARRLLLAEQNGLFIGEHTLEADLFRAGAHEEICDTLIELARGPRARARAQAWKDDPDSIDAERLLSDIEAIGKGRVAQRLSSRIVAGHEPAYILNAVRYVRARCR